MNARNIVVGKRWRRQTPEGRSWNLSPGSGLRFKEEQHEVLVSKLHEAGFRFTDKGEVEDRGFEDAKPSTTPCTEHEPQLADPAASLRQWPLPKLAGELIWPMSQTQPQIAYAVNYRLCIYMHREPDVAYGMISRIYRSLRDQRDRDQENCR
eukprot:g37256.t1